MTTEHVSVPREIISELESIQTAVIDAIKGDYDISLAMLCTRLTAILSRATPSNVTRGMGAQALAAEIVNAVAEDESTDGCDISAGLFGSAFSALIRKIAEEYLTPSLPSAPRVVTELVSIEDHNRLTTGPSPWTNTRVEKAAFNAARSVFGASTSDDDARVYRTLQAYIFATSLPHAAVPDGWKLVPLVPTAEMEDAAFDTFEIDDAKSQGFNSGTDVRNAIYKAMLAAAPQPEKKG